MRVPNAYVRPDTKLTTAADPTKRARQGRAVRFRALPYSPQLPRAFATGPTPSPAYRGRCAVRLADSIVAPHELVLVAARMGRSAQAALTASGSEPEKPFGRPPPLQTGTCSPHRDGWAALREPCARPGCSVISPVKDPIRSPWAPRLAVNPLRNVKGSLAGSSWGLTPGSAVRRAKSVR